jgi:hypothetical protein
MNERRRFPAPWSAERIEGGYLVKDASGFRLAYVYSPSNYDELGTASSGHLSPDDARRIAKAIARLPALLAAEKANSGGDES